MRVLVTTEQRFFRTADRAVWTPSQCPYAFWRNYLTAFDEVRIVARVQSCDTPDPHWRRVDGDGVTAADIPYYLGPWQYLRKRSAVVNAVRGELHPEDAVILRVPGQLPNCFEPELRRRGRPFAVEVLGDPWEVFAAGAAAHPLRAFFRRRFLRSQQRQCASCAASSYVTEGALQRRYPPAAASFSTHCSDVDLQSDAYADHPREQFQLHAPRIVAVGSLEQMYKGIDVLLNAVAAIRRQGSPARLTVVGDGKYRPQLESQAGELGLSACVRFAGQLPGAEAVRRELDEADLFVLPSRTEGLPRALIEAMARALPCVGSAIGGIPELLDSQDLVPPGDVQALTAKMLEVCNQPRLQEMSVRNLAKSQAYSAARLAARRREFYQTVREITADHIDSNLSNNKRRVQGKPHYPKYVSSDSGDRQHYV